MATPAEATQDMARVMDALVKARVYVAAHDQADAARAGAPEKIQNSALRSLLELAERAGERVQAHLTDGPQTGPLNPRDGGPL